MSSEEAPLNPLLTISAISLFTDDVAASKKFYLDVFGASVAFEDEESCAIKFNNGKLFVNLLQSSAAHGLVQPRKVAPREAGCRFQLTVWVNDLDAALERLKEHNVVILNGPEVKPWGLKVVNFEDPGGHSWEIGQHVKI